MHAPAPWDNVGTYSYDEALGAFVLISSGYDPTLVSQPFQLLPGDLVDPPFIPPLGGSEGGPNPPPGEDQPQSAGEAQLQSGCRLDPPTLPAVIVFAIDGRLFRFDRFILMARVPVGGRRGNVVRPTTVIEYIEIQPQVLTCAADFTDRYFAVHNAVRGSGSGLEPGVGGLIPVRLYLVQFSPGHRQWWSCRNMRASTCALREESDCSGDPPRPST